MEGEEVRVAFLDDEGAERKAEGDVVKSVRFTVVFAVKDRRGYGDF
jgi:hypothetical protein